MKYFVRNTGSSVIFGPYSLAEIEAKQKAGELSVDALAPEDCGTGLADVAPSPAEDWIPVNQFPGLGVQKVICPNCSHKFTGKVVAGETCPECNKLLVSAIEKPAGPRSFLGVLIQLLSGALTLFLSFILGFVTQLISLGVLCSFAKQGDKRLILPAVILCIVWIALGIPMVRRPSTASRGFAFGIFIGVGLTALLTTICAMN